MNKLLKIGILFGGQSKEHEVSLLSAENIFNNINKKKFKVYLIWINKKGSWYFCQSNNFLYFRRNKIKKIVIIPGNKYPLMIENKKPLKIDVIFPVTHGILGEDGSLQGLLRLINISFVGSSLLSSAINMDKEITKKLLKNMNFLISPFLVFHKNEIKKINYYNIIKLLGKNIFIKPTNQGSSIGINKVNDLKNFKLSINKAFDLDEKIIIEKEIIGKEVECGILGNFDFINTSVCGEIITKNNFYTYENKYKNNKESKIIIPAKIDSKISKKIRSISKKIFKFFYCKDMARIDFFVTKNKQIIVNEINTLPGFTKNSMYPKLWKYNNIKCKDLISKLIYLAITSKKKTY